MTISAFPPGLILVFGALLLVAARGRLRTLLALGLPPATLIAVWAVIGAKAAATVSFLGYTLMPVTVHAATPIFATVFCVMAFGGALFALKQNRTIELPAAFVYAGAAICVTFAGDLISLLIFWEIMMVGATVIIWSGGMKDSFRAGMRYFGMHAIGGVIMLTGITLHVLQAEAAGAVNPISFNRFTVMAGDGWMHFGPATAGPWLIMIGMLVNAAAPPFSAWLPDAYPEASPSGTVFLSAFTTKTAVFTLMIGFAGADILTYIGVYMALYGVIYAILENDFRRVLSYHMVSQVGYMICGIGIGTHLALNGVAAHAATHIVYKALLMMTAGSVLQMTGRRCCSDLGGLRRAMPLTTVCYIIGGLSISAFPFTSGFISKSMTIAAAAEHQVLVWFLLVAASVGTCLSVGIKVPWLVFFGKDSGGHGFAADSPAAAGGPQDPPRNMRAGMIFFAFICIFLGLFHGPLYALLPYRQAADFLPYTAAHVLGQAQLFMFAGLAFFLLLPLSRPTKTVTLDWDWLWRRCLPGVWGKVCRPALRGLDRGQTLLLKRLARSGSGGEGLFAGRQARSSWEVGRTVLLVVAMLLAYLMTYFWSAPG